MRYLGNAGPWQRVLVGALAKLAGIDTGRESDIRYHALVLGRGAADTEELGDGQLELAILHRFLTLPAVQVDDVLHRALAEGGFADHQAAAIVLHCAGKNFRGRGRATVDQHRQRPVPGHAGLAVAVDHHAATGLTYLHHRTLVDEQAGQLNGFIQRAAAVVAQVQHHPVDTLALELGQQPGHIAGGRGVICRVATTAFEVLVEGRQLDHADAALGPTVSARNQQGFALGALLGQTHLGTVQHHRTVLAIDAIGSGNVFQLDLGIGLATDLGHHIVDAPADHILDRAIAPLADADDAVARLQGAIQRGRTTGDDLADHHHIVLTLQLGTDAFQRQRHGLVEVLRTARGHVFGMRVDRVGIGIEKQREHVIALELVDRLEQGGVALVQGAADVLGRLAGQTQPQPVVLHRLAPDFIQLGAVGRPGRLFAVVVITLGQGEVRLALEQLAGMGNAFGGTLLVQREHLLGHVGTAGTDGVGHVSAQRRKRINIGLQEELTVAVQRLEVFIKHLVGRLDIQRARTIGITAVREQAVDQARSGGAVQAAGRRHCRGISLCDQGNRRGQRQCQQQGDRFGLH